MLLKNLLKLCLSAPRFPIYLLMAFTYVSSSGQKVTKIIFEGDAQKRFEAVEDFSAIAIKPSNYIDDVIYPVIINGEKVEIPLDPDTEEITFFKSLAPSGKSFEIDPDFKGAVFLINSGQVEIFENKSLRSYDNNCFAFQSVPQSSWREGLPAPNFDRIQNEVTHLIVHHTAGSNTNTNFTQVVRDIYLFHTEVNRWSDIGYNFLVAQDGTIFEGRDPGDDLTEFEVVGAHFCGKNTGTMGVAMLGNYESSTPSDNAIVSLQNVLASAADNFNIAVLEESDHRGSPLGHIAGHRDGCSTLCPGENLYPLLADISMEVSALLDCSPKDSVSTRRTFGFFPNPISTADLLQIETPDSIEVGDLISVSGKLWKSIPIQEGQMNLAGIPPGIYLLQVGDYQSQKLIIRK